MEESNCPICNHLRSTISRYPNKICQNCEMLTVTEKGEKIEFFNIDHTGGFMSIVNNVKGNIHECYVNNIKCYADEARFGGIVVSKIINKDH